MSLLNWPVGKRETFSWLMIPSAGSATPGHVVLRYLRKQTEQVMGNKPVSSDPPVSAKSLLPGFYLEPLPWLLFLMDYNSKLTWGLFSPSCFWSKQYKPSKHSVCMLEHMWRSETSWVNLHLLPPCLLWGSNSVCQAWWQVSLLTETSTLPCMSDH